MADRPRPQDIDFFTGVLGIAKVPYTFDGRVSLFREVVSLFDSLHDFGKLGSVYDYVTKTDSIYITSKKTVFNHLRNSYSQLVGFPNISLKNSQLHCYPDKFHLKSSLTKKSLEDTFYNYAKDHLYTKRLPAAIEYTANEQVTNEKQPLTYEKLIETFGEPLVFSIDTQKKLGMLTNRLGLTKNIYQTYDMEKVCDSGPHSNESMEGMHLLIEQVGAKREYTDVPGVEKVILNAFNSEGEINAKIKIDLVGSPGETKNVKMNAQEYHINNIANVNIQLKSLISNAPNEANINTKPDMKIYNTIDSYKNPANEKLKNYIYSIRRKLAQKRLGDQLQVLSCKETIKYTNGTVTNAIFVSIDRMAIAFAIANGVNCIYSNRDSLTLYKGINKPSIRITTPPNLGSAVSAPKPRKRRTRGGSRREEWELLESEIEKSPYHVLNIFKYATLSEGKATQKRFNDFIKDIQNVISTSCKDDGTNLDDSYYIRSYTNGPDDTIILDTPNNTVRENVVYLTDATQEWSIYRDGGNFTLINLKTKESITLLIAEMLGHISAMIEGENSAQEGGSNGNKEFLKVLAQYEILTLIDSEQMSLRYDEFYTQENGVPFYSPTFYELNAFFQELFRTEINYLSIYTFLQSKSTVDTYAQSIIVIMDRILDYMDVSIDTFVDPSESDSAILETILVDAKRKSDEYRDSLDSLKGYELHEYIFQNDITPMYFYRQYIEKYPIPISKDVSVRNFTMSSYHEPRMIAVMGGSKRKNRKVKRRNGSPRRKTRRSTKSRR